MTHVHEWHSCYDEGWGGLIVPEAFAHPAKYAHGLIRRIVEHGIERGWWRAGDTIGDPFGGVALGGIVCGYHGLNWIGVELESEKNDPPGSPFVELGNRNLDLHRGKWRALGYAVDVRLVQGDSHEFAAIVGQVQGCVTSPPYAESIHDGNGIDKTKLTGNPAGPNSQAGAEGYGSTPGQIGRLKSGQVDAVIASPPYAESIKGDHFERETAAESRTARNTPGGSLGQSQRHGGYGATEGNIGNLKAGQVDSVITSPPYAEGGGHRTGQAERDIEHGKGIYTPCDNYGHAPGNIGNLRSGSVDGVVTSPPWENSLDNIVSRADDGHDGGAVATFQRTGTWPERRPKGLDYGQSAGQIGNSTGETYWQAMRAVYAQMHLAMKPGGYAAVVVKDYVSKGKRVPMCDDTLKLLVSLGFEPVKRVHAMLVKEWTESTLFEGDVTRTKERKSFFRRLAEKKGSPKIDYEEVLVVQKGIDKGPSDAPGPD